MFRFFRRLWAVIRPAEALTPEAEKAAQPSQPPGEEPAEAQTGQSRSEPPAPRWLTVEQQLLEHFSRLLSQPVGGAQRPHYLKFDCSDGENTQTFLMVVDCSTLGRRDGRPVKIYPFAPTGQELFGRNEHCKDWTYGVFALADDPDAPGVPILDSPGMAQFCKSLNMGAQPTAQLCRELLDNVERWCMETAAPRRRALADRPAKAQRRDFSYSKKSCQRCKRVVLSQRAYLSLLAEAISRSPLETGGILLGRWGEDGTWYVVEATDPGMDTIHTHSHHEMDQDYHNHIYPVLSRLYKHDLRLLGLWHRHPGSLDTFSHDDNMTNRAFSQAIGNGTLSFLVNFDPDFRLTCYYMDNEGSGEYFKLPVSIGDKHFKGTDLLALTDDQTLWERRAQLREEIGRHHKEEAS